MLTSLYWLQYKLPHDCKCKKIITIVVKTVYYETESLHSDGQHSNNNSKKYNHFSHQAIDHIKKYQDIWR
jgi:hypothetical protein